MTQLPCRRVFILHAHVLYQRPRSLRFLLFLVPHCLLFLLEILDDIPVICRSRSLSLGVTDRGL